MVITLVLPPKQAEHRPRLFQNTSLRRIFRLQGEVEAT
jgi:hypothetical protein